MKRLTMFVLLLLFAVGMTNAQTTDWKTETLKWSSSATSTIKLTGTTTYSDAVTLPISVAGSQTSQAGVIEKKFPNKLTFQIILIENTGDSSNVIHTLQLSGDGTTYFDYVAIDTSLSITTANQTYAMFEVMTGFPEIEYARVKSYFATGITDTVQYMGWMSKSFTQ